MEIWNWFLEEIIYKPLNFALFVIFVILVDRIFRSKKKFEIEQKQEDELKPLKPIRRDFTLQELREFDGIKNDGRILIALNGNVYDVTKGQHFYGPGCPYGSFAGRDASRGLGTFSVKVSEEYDDLSDLKPSEMELVREWEEQFKERYIYVGKLLKPGEEPSIYPENEDLDITPEQNLKK